MVNQHCFPALDQTTLHCIDHREKHMKYVMHLLLRIGGYWLWNSPGQWRSIVTGANQNEFKIITLRWRQNDHAGVSDHQPHRCLLNRLFGRKSKKTSKLRVTGLCAGNSQGTGEFPAQMASYAENVSIWWRHHESQSKRQWHFRKLYQSRGWRITVMT